MRTNSLFPPSQWPSTGSAWNWPDKAARAADRARALAAITSLVDVRDYTETAAVQHARRIAHARRSGIPRGAHDLVIAAHAAQTNRTILSYDAKARFADLPGVLAEEP